MSSSAHLLLGRILTEQGREAEDGGMSGATVVGKKKSSQTQRPSLEVPSQMSQGLFGGSARKSTGLQGGAIITWFGEGLARTSEPGDGSVVMARNNFPWLECGTDRKPYHSELSITTPFGRSASRRIWQEEANRDWFWRWMRHRCGRNHRVAYRRDSLPKVHSDDGIADPQDHIIHFRRAMIPTCIPQPKRDADARCS
ncbi:hypothetical protein FNV43_RR21633 [Rhamnella rubrinervis]|uniref:Uncharacterized protein n=1 Tax=Rhamnella rubrinervis TaxID=2594499 RepID=A0A8K0GRT1_9ROSA|nr:hypothetical protein FNV43_RR21633 [Rhamnella rubrinervis]